LRAFSETETRLPELEAGLTVDGKKGKKEKKREKRKKGGKKKEKGDCIATVICFRKRNNEIK